MATWSRTRSAVVGRTLGIYVTACFAGLQVLDIAVERLGLSDRLFLTTMILLVLGVPVVLVIALLRSAPAVEGTGRRRYGWRPAVLHSIGVLAGVLALAALLFRLNGAGVAWGASGMLRSGEDGGEPAPLVWAGFSSRTVDGVLAEVMSDAVRVDLERTAGVRLLGAPGIWRPLAAWAASGVDGAAAAVQREVAARAGASAVALAQVERLGSSYLLTARLVRLGDGVPLAALRTTAADSAHLHEALDALSAGLRERAGALRSPVRSPAPPAAEQIRAYVDGLHALRVRADTAAALPLLERAATAPRFARAALDRGLALFCTGAPLDAVQVALRTAEAARPAFTAGEWYELLAARYVILEDQPRRGVAALRLSLDEQPEHTDVRRRLAALEAEADPRTVFCS